MITDKDVEELIEDLRAYNDAWVLEEGKDRDRLIEFESAIRAESAEQTRKEAAERAVRFFDDFRICVPPNKYNMPQETLEQLRAAIIGDSVIKENLTTDHIPDTGKKLAIAVKALEKINERHSFADIVDDSYIISRDALREIQG